MEELQGELTNSHHCVRDFYIGCQSPSKIIFFEGEGNVFQLDCDFFGLFILPTWGLVIHGYVGMIYTFDALSYHNCCSNNLPFLSPNCSILFILAIASVNFFLVKVRFPLLSNCGYICVFFSFCSIFIISLFCVLEVEVLTIQPCYQSKTSNALMFR